MKKPWKTPKILAEVLKTALDKWKLTPILKRHEVMAAWDSLAGPQLAQRARPLKIQGSQMVLEVDHPAWIQELNYLKPRLLEKIAQSYPESRIKSLRFVLK